MFMTLRIALLAIARNKLRSGLTALGIIIGVAAVIAMVAIGQGATEMVHRQMAAMGEAIIWVQPGSAASGGISFGAGSTTTLTPEDGDAVARECEHVLAAAPIVRDQDQLIYGNLNWRPMELDGTTPEFLPARGWNLSSGDFFTSQDVRNANKVCVVGQTIVDNLFQGLDPIGETVRIKQVPFKVVGVFEKKGSNMMGMDQDDFVAAPYTTVKKRLTGSQFNNVDRLIVAATSGADLKVAQREITELLHDRHHISATQVDDFNLRDLTELSNMLTKMTGTMTMLLMAVASVSLLVGGVGIMNIMLVSVTERTREIGIRMAIGARGGDILRQFLVESVVLSALGGVIGIGVGLLISWLIASQAHWPVLFSPISVLVAFGFSALVGIFFGFYPARKASQLDPIDCLRYE